MELKFYVYEPGSGYTKYKHESQESAEREAQRLAFDNPNKEFEILARIAKCRVPAGVTWDRVKVEDIPF
jgi:hypothetical protein